MSNDAVAHDLSVEAEAEFTSVQSWRGWAVKVAMLFLTLLASSFVIFLATQVLPGDPATHVLGKNATPEALRTLRSQLHLDQPLLQQYWTWLKGVLSGDLGTSISARIPVSQLIGNRIVNTATLVFFAAVVTVPLSVIFGVVGAVKRDKAIDHTFAGFAVVFTAVPDFVVGMVLLIVFATTVFKVFPAVSLIPDGSSPFSNLSALVLPVATLTLVSVPYLGRLLRASMIDILQSEFVAWARLKGISERDVILKHALPNSLVPLVQGSALILAYMAGGIVVIEYLFAFPGLGSALLQAVQTRDIPVIQAICLIFAAFYCVVNLVADALCVFVTPRLRRGAR